MTQDRIIDMIYDAVVDADATRPMAAAIAHHLGAESGMTLIGMDGDAPPVAGFTHGLDEDIVAGYQNGFYRHDPWKSVILQIPVGRPYAMERLVSRHTYQHSRIYQDLARGRADVFQCLGLVFRIGLTLNTFGVFRGKRDRTFDETDEQRLAPLVPHLRRLLLAIKRKATSLPLCVEDLASHPDPVIITDQVARPIHCSDDGAALIDSRTVFIRTASGRLRSVDRALSLEGHVRAAALRRIPSIHRIDPPAGTHIVSIDPCHQMHGHATITVRNRQFHAARKAHAAAVRFDLTAAEALLLTSLSNGLTLEDHSIARGVSITTTRSQLQSLFAKTGTERQSELLLTTFETPTR